jgi:hypothetical protein
MALVECKECRKAVSNSAAVCPHCGVAAPALSAEEKADAVITFKRAMHGRIGGWLFFAGVAWLFFLIATGAEKESVVSAWGFAKYLIIGGLGAYVISEIERNLAERKQKK